MSIDERRRLELAEAAKRTLGDAAGITLMELLPPVGWADVATKQDLAALEQRIDLRFAAVDERFNAFDLKLDAKLDVLEHKLMNAFHEEIITLTWRFVGAMGALFAGFTAVITLVVRL